MAGLRTYADSCGIARALDAVGERWALLVVRELLLGPMRFTDLRLALPGISADILAQRLRDLEIAAVLHRATLPPPAASKVYELTDRGRDLRPVLIALGNWGSTVPLGENPAPLSSAALALALPTTFDPVHAAGLRVNAVLRFDRDSISAEIADDQLTVTRGTGSAPVDLVFDTDTGHLARLLWRGDRLGSQVRTGALRLTGDSGLAARFLAVFAPPQ